MLQQQLEMTLDKLSNDEFDGLTIDEAWIDEAAEEFKAALRKQLTPQDRDFRLRMSNVGKPLCQLQHGAMGSEKKRKDYNFKIQMLIGDAVECITNIMLKIAGANITGGKNQVELKICETVVRGEDDIEIDHKVYDVKSCSPWAFDNKWNKGYSGLKEDDPFGYVGQLTGYAQAQNKELGGWIVVNKSNGRIAVVDAEVSETEKQMNLFKMEHNVDQVTTGAPLDRQFAPIPDTFRGKPTGLKRLAKSCEWCDFIKPCYPKAKYMPHPKSEAKNPPMYWFIEDD
jgi:hypothetical protein